MVAIHVSAGGLGPEQHAGPARLQVPGKTQGGLAEVLSCLLSMACSPDV